MSESASDRSRLFTLEEARALLPDIRRLLARFAAARAAADTVVAALDDLETQRNRANTLELARPLREHREQLGVHAEAMRAAVRAVAALGVEIKGLDPALIDFHSIRAGRVVYLCWREDEETISFWHDLDTGFTGRRLL